jgi:hypothetical protein
MPRLRIRAPPSPLQKSRRIDRLSLIFEREAAMTRDVWGIEAIVGESSFRVLRQALELDDG